MKMNVTHFLLFAILLPFYSLGQSAGDYRSNVAKDGNWEVPANWETFNGTTWVKASTYPKSSDGRITITKGDSIRLTSTITIDQVQVESGGILAIFNLKDTSTIRLTLNDGPENDLSISGKLYVSVNLNLSGPGSLAVNNGGLLVARNTTTLAVATIIQPGAEMQVASLIELRSTLTNNGKINWLTSNLRMSGGTLRNNGSLDIYTRNDVFISNTEGTNLVFNSGTGVITKIHEEGSVNINAPLQNEGVISGVGVFSLNRVNTGGTLSPGNPIGILTVNPPAAFRRPFTVQIRINSGSGAGTGHDQLIATGNPDLSNTTLRVTENTSTPIGTYTVMKASSGTFTGNFSSVRLPRGYVLEYTPGSSEVKVKKTEQITPFVLGPLTGVGKDGGVTLDWTTLKEANTSHFTIEHSIDGQHFFPAGTVPAKGNATTPTTYSFVHTNPDLARNNFYRLVGVDLDENITLSPVVSVKFKDQQPISAFAYPNPTRNILYLQVQADQVEVRLFDQRGSWLHHQKTSVGINELDMTSLPTGIYYLVVYRRMQKVEVQKILKHD